MDGYRIPRKTKKFAYRELEARQTSRTRRRARRLAKFMRSIWE